MESDIVTINAEISDIEVFDQSMINAGYELVAKSFLVKQLGDTTINITRRNDKIETITAYRNDEIIAIPHDILIQVKNDIKNSL